MKVRLTFEFDEEMRNAIAFHFGRPGAMDREGIENWIRMLVAGGLEDLLFELRMKGKKEDKPEGGKG